MNKKSQLSSMFASNIQDNFIKVSLASDLMKIVESPSRVSKDAYSKPLNVNYSSMQDLYRMGFINFNNDNDIKITAQGIKLLENFILNSDDCTLKDKPRYEMKSNSIRRI